MVRGQKRGRSSAIERHLRRNSTSGETVAWCVLRGSRFGVKFRRQHRFGAFVLDFYCAELRLAIDIDGAPHLTDDGRRYDAARSRKLESLGVRVARFSNNAVYASPDWFGAQVRALIEERREEISKMRSVVIDVRRP